MWPGSLVYRLAAFVLRQQSRTAATQAVGGPRSLKYSLPTCLCREGLPAPVLDRLLSLVLWFVGGVC